MRWRRQQVQVTVSVAAAAGRFPRRRAELNTDFVHSSLSSLCVVAAAAISSPPPLKEVSLRSQSNFGERAAAAAGGLTDGRSVGRTVGRSVSRHSRDSRSGRLDFSHALRHESPHSDPLTGSLARSLALTPQ